MPTSYVPLHPALFWPYVFELCMGMPPLMLAFRSVALRSNLFNCSSGHCRLNPSAGISNSLTSNFLVCWVQAPQPLGKFVAGRKPLSYDVPIIQTCCPGASLGAAAIAGTVFAASAVFAAVVFVVLALLARRRWNGRAGNPAKGISGVVAGGDAEPGRGGGGGAVSSLGGVGVGAVNSLGGAGGGMEGEIELASQQLGEILDMSPEDIVICSRPEGGDWLLGEGSYGCVSVFSPYCKGTGLGLVCNGLQIPAPYGKSLLLRVNRTFCPTRVVACLRMGGNSGHAGDKTLEGIASYCSLSVLSTTQFNYCYHHPLVPSVLHLRLLVNIHLFARPSAIENLFIQPLATSNK